MIACHYEALLITKILIIEFLWQQYYRQAVFSVCD